MGRAIHPVGLAWSGWKSSFPVGRLPRARLGRLRHWHRLYDSPALLACGLHPPTPGAR